MKKLVFVALFSMMVSVAYPATMTITIPNEVVTEVIEAFAVEAQYPATVPDPACVNEMDCAYIPNPMSKSDFAKAQIRAYIKSVYVAYRVKAAVNQAKEDSEDTANIDVGGVVVE